MCFQLISHLCLQVCCFNYTGEENVSLPIIDGGTFLYSMLQSLHQEELLNRTSVPILLLIPFSLLPQIYNLGVRVLSFFSH